MADQHVPQAWQDLIEGLTTLSRAQVNPTSPTWCAHDVLMVSADPDAFTDDEHEHLNRLGFIGDSVNTCFYSFRFGSA